MRDKNEYVYDFQCISTSDKAKSRLPEAISDLRKSEVYEWSYYMKLFL